MQDSIDIQGGKIKDFRTLHVWEKSHALTLAIYKATNSFPKQETYGVTSQIQCAAVSIPTNIAEGCGKDSDAELKRFFLIAMGLSSELEYLLLLAHDLSCLTAERYNDLHDDVVEVRKMVNSFIQRLKATS